MKVGSLVECVKNYSQAWEGLKVPVKGQIYTVREIIEPSEEHRRLDEARDLYYLRLEEIVNEPVQNALDEVSEPAFNIQAFREIMIPLLIEMQIFSLLHEPILIPIYHE